MTLARLSNLPVRIATGAFILNSGISKLSAEKETAEGVHGMAKGAYPFLENVDAGQFTKALGLVETALGGALLVPLVSDGLAGLALSAFAGGLLGLYNKTPGMRGEGSIRPTQQGMPLAKDAWLLGIGLSLIADAGRTGRLRRAKARASQD